MDPRLEKWGLSRDKSHGTKIGISEQLMWNEDGYGVFKVDFTA